ncbi:MAG TPA: hypothetical protein GXZ43_02395 [Clostridiaceae bacterium]|nr:hypothetical protein [Clostridiaceae bacterium]
MSNQERKKEYSVTATPVTEVKQYTFGSEAEPKKRNQVKRNRQNRNRRSQRKRNVINKKQIAKQNTGGQTPKTDNSQPARKTVGVQQTVIISDKTQSDKRQTFKTQQKKNKNKRNLQSNIPVKLVKTAADVKKDNQRIEKEIILDIKEISRIEI